MFDHYHACFWGGHESCFQVLEQIKESDESFFFERRAPFAVTVVLPRPGVKSLTLLSDSPHGLTPMTIPLLFHLVITLDDYIKEQICEAKIYKIPKISHVVEMIGAVAIAGSTPIL